MSVYHAMEHSRVMLVPRLVSFIVLVAIVLLIGALSFKVMANFYVPLFLAAVMVVVFRPLHRWALYRCRGRRQLAAVFTTVSIVLIVLLPLTGLLIRAIAEGSAMITNYTNSLPIEMVKPSNTSAQIHAGSQAQLGDITEGHQELANEKELSTGQHTTGQPADLASSLPESDVMTEIENKEAVEQLKAVALHDFLDRCIDAVDDTLIKLKLPTLPADDVHTFVREKVTQAAAPLAFGGVRVLVGALVGLAIMVLALYYFFADGPGMIDSLMRLSPLDDGYEQELLDKFGDISRAVVLATLLSAIVQGVLASVGYYFVGIDRIFFLTALTMFLAMVPFIGAAAVWVPVCAWVYFYQGRVMPAALLAIYCVVVVSMVDNVIKPMVLHGRSNLHPLLALLSVVGGAQALGPIGILVGPMLVSLLQALLVMLNKELRILGADKSVAALIPSGVGDHSSEIAETVVAPGYGKSPADASQGSAAKPKQGT
jgi:predicted PurR-regulated permease PerM